MMENLNITDMKYEPCVDSKFVVPARVTFKQNGINRHWDYVKVHDAVAILIYNKTRDAFVLVKQFRPAPYVNINARMLKEEVTDVSNASFKKDFQRIAPYSRGVTYELCAGIVDEKKSYIEIAQKEIEEETGYVVPLGNITKIFQHRNVGHSGNRVDVYYTEVTDEMKTADGGGTTDSGEFIELHYLPRAQIKEFVRSEHYVKPSSCIAALLWYLTENN